jgi:hypothetical protein
MLRKYSVLLMMTLLLVLSGCQRAPSITALINIQKIELLNITGFSAEDAPVLRTFTAQEEITLMIKAINSSSKIDGILDVVQPDYALKLYGNNNKSSIFFLWVNNSSDQYSGMIMDAKDTHTGYSLQEGYAKQIFTLIHGTDQ